MPLSDHAATAADAAPLPPQVDVLVVGGGINGSGIARDLAGRGLSVLLAERDDLAQHTSSASTKLIHGGLRYLEHRAFGLVRKALAERERLLASAPHAMRPMRFVMPHDPTMRPAWLIRCGLFLYDHLARRQWLPGSHGVDLRQHPAGAALRPEFRRGFVYSDGWVDDARLVVLNALDAQRLGATVRTRCPVTEAGRDGHGWLVRLAPRGQAACAVRARALVNAAGPWAAQLLRQQLNRPQGQGLRLVRGSHIVVPALFEHDHAYLFQNPDGRVLFAIPYEGRFTLIGTTDVECPPQPGPARISAEEIGYLCAQASRCFRQTVTPDRVVWHYSGVRPLLDDESGNASAITRDYRLDFEGVAAEGTAPLLTVWGGKLTTYRKLAEEAGDGLTQRLGQPRTAWTTQARLPGGDLSATIGAATRPDHDIARFTEHLLRQHPRLPPALLARWALAYGARVDELLRPVLASGDADAPSDPNHPCPGLGAEVAPGLHEAELWFLHRSEWARCADDVLWRRSKLGLHLSPAQRADVARWCAQHWPGADALDAPVES